MSGSKGDSFSYCVNFLYLSHIWRKKLFGGNESDSFDGSDFVETLDTIGAQDMVGCVSYPHTMRIGDEAGDGEGGGGRAYGQGRGTIRRGERYRSAALRAMPTLFVVATPIGNLEDVTLRALRVLREVGLIAAEDTRTTRKLLLRHEIRTPLISYNEHNREERIPHLLARLREADVALVSDAGTPGIRDPGRELVLAAVQQGVPVVPVPGPSAVTTALAVSGLPADQFLFLGYLPRRDKERRALLTSVASEARTVVVFEAPHRIRASLGDLVATLGEQRQIVVCRELTKVYEEIYRGTAGQAAAHFAKPKGEFTLLISGSDAVQQETPADAEKVVEELRRLKSDGLSAREAVGAIAERHGLPRRRVYALWLEL